MKITGLGTLLVLATAAAAADAGDKFPKCFKADRDGHCVAARVNGQSTVKMTKKVKSLLKPRGGVSFGNCDAHYEVPLPIRGDLALDYEWIPEAVGYFGAPPDVLVHVYPLEGQSLETRSEFAASPLVRAGGSALVRQADIMQGNRLPPGKYVITSRVSGSKENWDCHSFFLEVAE